MDYLIDAKDKRFGRVASEIALVLQGKRSPKYEKNRVGEDRVLVRNVRKITLSGSKAEDKIYYRHTGYMGHLKELTFRQAFVKDPKRVFREAVRHMLPKNFLTDRRLKNLIFVEDE